jgi:hypothetical protein
MATKRLEGTFAVRERAAGKFFLVLESGPGLSVSLELKPNATTENAHDLAAELNRAIVAAEVDWVTSRR